MYGAIASGFEQGTGITRVGSNFQIYSATERGGVFMGNQFVKTVGLSEVGHAAGIAGATITTSIDLINYANNDPNTPGSKVVENGVFTTIGLKGGWPGAIISGIYFGLQGYYPGGANQAAYDFSNRFGQHAQSWGQIKMEQGGL